MWGHPFVHASHFWTSPTTDREGSLPSDCNPPHRYSAATVLYALKVVEIYCGNGGWWINSGPGLAVHDNAAGAIAHCAMLMQRVDAASPGRRALLPNIGSESSAIHRNQAGS